MGFEKPTAIQEKAIPMLLENNPTDFIGLAQTGTGKTAAFGLPLIDLIDANNSSTQALIMAPTRELGQQTAQQLVTFSKSKKGVNVEVVYGGADIRAQMKALRRPTQIVVATPGRLLDLIKRKAINLENVEYVVLDEADEMLNMGFKDDIDEILSHTLENRVTWLFSATMPREIRRLVKTYMKDPLEVAVDAEQKSNKDIAHQYVVTKADNKISALKRFLDIQPDMKGIMFCRTKMDTQEIADDLSKQGYSVAALHGDLSQNQRDTVMRHFKTRSMQLLVATDVAARGIDVNDLTHVFHHKLPDQLESYTHRSGRTGRAGNKGISMAFINPREGRKITDIERKMSITFEKVTIPTIDELKVKRLNNWASLILNTTVDEKADDILASLQGRFEGLSKEDLLKRLITTQLDHLMVQGGGADDLNEGQGQGQGRDRDRDGRSRDRDAGPKHERQSRTKEGTNRYFINIGTMDGVTDADLIHFISDITGVGRRLFTDLSIQKNCSFFNVDAKHDDDLSKRFDDIEVEGRSIRVNRDEEGRSSARPNPRNRNDRSGGNRSNYSGNSSSRRSSGGSGSRGRRR
ncbi:DEAD/DEAH box helicase [Roseivirga sp.]|nr:DEAD/DEAH box helicase [Roseivirga sp.]